MIVGYPGHGDALYHGQRMSATEYFSLAEDGHRYELIDGVVCMSPSPSIRHQRVVTWLVTQIAMFLEAHPVGEVLVEVDVHLGSGAGGGDVVYRPDLVYLRSGRLAPGAERVTGAPDLVVEVVSPASRTQDSVTKKADYERCGIGEYWLIDPERQKLAFHVLRAGGYQLVSPERDRLECVSIPGFVLDVAKLRAVSALA